MCMNVCDNVLPPLTHTPPAVQPLPCSNTGCWSQGLAQADSDQ